MQLRVLKKYKYTIDDTHIVQGANVLGHGRLLGCRNGSIKIGNFGHIIVINLFCTELQYYNCIPKCWHISNLCAKSFWSARIPCLAQFQQES